MVYKAKEIYSSERFEHVCGVVLKALRLNDRLSLDFSKVFTAALLHDIGKGNVRRVECVPLDAIGTKVEHQFSGPFIAKELFGITDEDVLNAIRYHTTGRIGMSTLEKLIYTADMIEDGRDFDGVDIIRKKTDIGLDEGFKECLKQTYLHLKSNGVEIYYLTKEAYNYYIEVQNG